MSRSISWHRIEFNCSSQHQQNWQQNKRCAQFLCYCRCCSFSQTQCCLFGHFEPHQIRNTHTLHMFVLLYYYSVWYVDCQAASKTTMVSSQVEHIGIEIKKSAHTHTLKQNKTSTLKIKYEKNYTC